MVGNRVISSEIVASVIVLSAVFLRILLVKSWLTDCPVLHTNGDHLGLRARQRALADLLAGSHQIDQALVVSKLGALMYERETDELL